MIKVAEEPLEVPIAGTDVPTVSLEDRVSRLETMVADYSIPPHLEETIAARVISKLSNPEVPEGPRSLVAPERVVVTPSQPEEPRPQTPPPPPTGAVLRPPESTVMEAAARRWFVIQFWSEVRLLVHMYFDPRYRISRTTQFAVPGIALMMVFNYFFFASWGNIPFVGPILERLLDVVACVIGYKLLQRELGRYRDVLNYLSRFGGQ
jgi:hypothetical protein